MMELARNKKAYFDYEILETGEAGIQLLWHEVKSLRAKNVNLKWSYISYQNNELWLKWMHIWAWNTLSNKEVVDTGRPRKIFLPRKKIISYGSKLKEWGYTLLALELYLKGSLIKTRVGLAKGKKSYQKKQTLKERTLDREAQKMLKKNY